MKRRGKGKESKEAIKSGRKEGRWLRREKKQYEMTKGTGAAQKRDKQRERKMRGV